jgi:drug/metabolite transporter (DMT)-like permease
MDLLADRPPHPRPAARLTVLAAATTVLLWASAFVVIRSVGHVLEPGPMAFTRLLTGTVVLSLLALRGRRRLPHGRALATLVGYGVAWFAGYTVLLNGAERHLDAGTAAMLVNVAPVLVAVTAGLLFGEGFPRPLVVGLVVALAGIAVISLGSRGGGADDTLGIVLGLGAAVLYAAGVLLQKVTLRSVDAVTATWLGCAVGALATAPFAGQAWTQLAAAPARDVVGVVFLGVGPTAVAFTTWAYALSRTDAGRMAATTLTVPALAIVLSWLALGEVPTPLGFAGGVLCLAGVAVTRLRSRAAVAAEAVPASEPAG